MILYKTECWKLKDLVLQIQIQKKRYLIQIDYLIKNIVSKYNKNYILNPPHNFYIIIRIINQIIQIYKIFAKIKLKWINLNLYNTNQKI